ncbi:MAG: ParA family protein [Anaerotruncus sp.]|jgi:chromosome partitioning protein|nr:ParA family protein [Anaerotruncus sp.]
MKATVLGFINEKGGVGKSTSAATTAYLLAKQGKKVLLIDFDGQGHASLLCGVQNINRQEITIATLMNHIIDGEALPKPEQYLVHHAGVDLVPSNSQLFALERNLANADFRETKLREYVQTMRSSYEYILIDCMPNGGTPQINVMLAADALVIPTQAEVFSAVGLSQLARHASTIARNTGHSLKITGVLLTMLDQRTCLAREIGEMLAEHTQQNSIPIFQTKIPRSTKVGEAALYGQTICEYLPKHPAALAYEAFVKELIADA